VRVFLKKNENPGNRAHSFGEEHGLFFYFAEREMGFSAALRFVLARVGSGAVDWSSDVVHPHKCRNLGCLSFFFCSSLFILPTCLPSTPLFLGPIN